MTAAKSTGGNEAAASKEVQTKGPHSVSVTTPGPCVKRSLVSAAHDADD
jgi:hypothetical protein